jgi:molecular chaperone HscB
MICWSCERALDGRPVMCTHCGAIQPPDTATDHFAVLGVPRAYALDVGDAEARFKELSRQLHPDRFAKADPRARRASLARSVQLNEAWRTLRDPVRRAEYLLSLSGYAIGAEEGASRPAGASEAAAAETKRVPITAPPALLMEILELREALGEAREAGDQARVRQMAADVGTRSDGALAAVATALDQADRAGTPAAAAAARETAARQLIALRYFRRFLDEATAGGAAENEARP